MHEDHNFSAVENDVAIDLEKEFSWLSSTHL